MILSSTSEIQPLAVFRLSDLPVSLQHLIWKTPAVLRSWNLDFRQKLNTWSWTLTTSSSLATMRQWMSGKNGWDFRNPWLFFRCFPGVSFGHHLFYVVSSYISSLTNHLRMKPPVFEPWQAPFVFDKYIESRKDKNIFQSQLELGMITLTWQFSLLSE